MPENYENKKQAEGGEMSKCTITIYDADNGETTVTCDFSPSLQRGQTRTPAQSLALGLIEAMASVAEKTKIIPEAGGAK